MHRVINPRQEKNTCLKSFECKKVSSAVSHVSFAFTRSQPLQPNAARCFLSIRFDQRLIFVSRMIKISICFIVKEVRHSGTRDQKRAVVERAI